MPTIELPDGHTAEMREEDDLRRADERAIYKMADADGIDLTKPGMDMIGALQDAMIVRFTRRWSLLNGDGSSPLPVTLEAVKDLPLKFHRPLKTYINPLMQQIIGEQESPSPLLGAPS